MLRKTELMAKEAVRFCSSYFTDTNPGSSELSFLLHYILPEDSAIVLIVAIREASFARH